MMGGWVGREGKGLSNNAPYDYDYFTVENKNSRPRLQFVPVQVYI